MDGRRRDVQALEGLATAPGALHVQDVGHDARVRELAQEDVELVAGLNFDGTAVRSQERGS